MKRKRTIRRGGTNRIIGQEKKHRNPGRRKAIRTNRKMGKTNRRQTNRRQTNRRQTNRRQTNRIMTNRRKMNGGGLMWLRRGGKGVCRLVKKLKEKDMNKYFRQYYNPIDMFAFIAYLGNHGKSPHRQSPFGRVKNKYDFENYHNAAGVFLESFLKQLGDLGKDQYYKALGEEAMNINEVSDGSKAKKKVLLEEAVNGLDKTWKIADPRAKKRVWDQGIDTYNLVPPPPEEAVKLMDGVYDKWKRENEILELGQQNAQQQADLLSRMDTVSTGNSDREKLYEKFFNNKLSQEEQMKETPEIAKFRKTLAGWSSTSASRMMPADEKKEKVQASNVYMEKDKYINELDPETVKENIETYVEYIMGEREKAVTSAEGGGLRDKFKGELIPKGLEKGMALGGDLKLRIDGSKLFFKSLDKKEEKEAAEDAAVAAGRADQEMLRGTRICVSNRWCGSYVSFNKNTFGANEHTIAFDSGKTVPVNLKKKDWTVKGADVDKIEAKEKARQEDRGYTLTKSRKEEMIKTFFKNFIERCAGVTGTAAVTESEQKAKVKFFFEWLANSKYHNWLKRIFSESWILYYLERVRGLGTEKLSPEDINAREALLAPPSEEKAAAAPEGAAAAPDADGPPAKKPKEARKKKKAKKEAGKKPKESPPPKSTAVPFHEDAKLKAERDMKIKAGVVRE